ERVRQPLLLGEAEQGLDLRADVKLLHFAAVERGDERDRGDALDEGPVAELGPPRVGLRGADRRQRRRARRERECGDLVEDHPAASSKSTWCCASTPSAMTRIRSARARATTALTIEWLAGSLDIVLTNDRSIFMAFTGMRCRWLRDE